MRRAAGEGLLRSIVQDAVCGPLVGVHSCSPLWGADQRGGAGAALALARRLRVLRGMPSLFVAAAAAGARFSAKASHWNSRCRPSADACASPTLQVGWARATSLFHVVWHDTCVARCSCPVRSRVLCPVLPVRSVCGAGCIYHITWLAAAAAAALTNSCKGVCPSAHMARSLTLA